MTETYRAAICTALTGPSSIEIQRRTVSPLKPGEVRIRVRACGLNFPDLLMTRGLYQFRPDPPFVPGMEVAGDVIETALDVTAFKVGDRVTAGGKGGGFAEHFVAHLSAVRCLPPALTYEEGACWRAGAVTAWHALHDKAGVQPGEAILVLGASGGVGMAAVKLGKHLGARVIGTASTPEKRDAVRAAGADDVLDPADPNLAARCKELTGARGVDIVYDPVGGDLALTATRAIGWGGRYLIVGFASGAIPQFPANHALIKGYSLIGLRAGEASRRDPDLAVRTDLALRELAENGVMRPCISHRFPLDQTQDALNLLDQRAVIGRAILVMNAV